jgi:hypothetical protein
LSPNLSVPNKVTVSIQSQAMGVNLVGGKVNI